MSTHTPRKRFGQNFLVDTQIISEIVATINPLPGQYLVEIGPGQGAITKGLVATGVQVDAVELDRDLAAQLSVDFAHKPNFTLHSADILNFDLKKLYQHNNKHKLRLVGNLPYNISTPLLFKLFDEVAIIQDMHFMLQKEVAQRLSATPGSKDYGRMSVMAQYYCFIDTVIEVPPESFNPVPKVDSCIVYFKPHLSAPVEVQDPTLLHRIATAAFNQRRKTITNSLKGFLTAEELQGLGIDQKLRAEDLGLDDYAKISNYVHSNGH